MMAMKMPRQATVTNGIAFANSKPSEITIQSVKPLDDMMIIITFSTCEKRLYDATQLLAFPAFQPLKDEKAFRSANVEYGVVAWNDSEIDIAPETMYENSYEYPDMYEQKPARTAQSKRFPRVLLSLEITSQNIS